MKASFTIEAADAYDGSKGEFRVAGDGGGVDIAMPGYGNATTEDGYGVPVFLEYRHGVPHVVVFADINQEDPTHVISLAGAAEALRKD